MDSNFQNYNWTKSEFASLIEFLDELSDSEYQAFVFRGIMTKWQILGVRVPELRKIASKITLGDWQSFLKTKPQCFEDVMIRGFIIAKLPGDDLWCEFDNFIPLIDNWSICDSFAASLKVFKNKDSRHVSLIKKLLDSRRIFDARLALVILKCYYLSGPNNLEWIFSILDKLKRNEYYIKMAEAWLLAECFIKYPTETKEYMTHSKLDDWTFNKAISKCRDSLRLDSESKEALNILRRRG